MAVSYSRGFYKVHGVRLAFVREYGKSKLLERLCLYL